MVMRSEAVPSLFGIDPSKTVIQICSKGHKWHVFRKLPKAVVDKKCPECKSIAEKARSLKSALRRQKKQEKKWPEEGKLE